MRKLGFTLAEVLITLVIIGVIAAMTVPTLMNNTNAQEYRSALKKAISATNQALTLHYALEGVGAQDYSTADELISNVFNKRMSVISGTGSDEFSNTTECNGSTFTTADGIQFCIKDWAVGASDDQTAACNSYNTQPCVSGNNANLWIDVNGKRNPNKMTTSSNQPKDIYQAQIYNQKVVPFGAPTQEVMFDKPAS